MAEIIHFTHVWGLGFGVACSQVGGDWKQTTDRDGVTCKRCQETIMYRPVIRVAAPTEGETDG
ncbi:hypothetical protein LCGC14_1364300 [marine sediment metagenome]|uniref:Uncharacterized protein n=1 Tax=marine sediment metagenome TaxID=412755 RepID=A0A0F9N9A7_9ZZZZ